MLFGKISPSLRTEETITAMIPVSTKSVLSAVSEKFLELQQMRPPRQLHQSDRDRGLGSSDT